MNDKPIEHKFSDTAFSMFMRQLHILALVQHSTSLENMNYRSMADLLSAVPWDDNIDENKIKRCVNNLKEMGFPLHTGRGENRVVLERELSVEEMLEILPYYMNVVSDTVGIRDCFKSYVDSHGSRSLWIIARIYFAALASKKIKLTYRSLNKTVPEIYLLNPWMWIYRDNAVYLVARNPLRGQVPSLFRLNRISDVEVTNESFDDSIPSSSDLFRNSMGAFIGKQSYSIKLRFHEDEVERIEEAFGHLVPEFSGREDDGYMYAVFTAGDLVNVCTAVFRFCGRVRIVEPFEAINMMKKMIQDSNVY